jgi:hypothetical protein
VLPDGRVLVPAGFPEIASLLAALGDERAARACGQAGMTTVLIGRRMCG